MSNTNKRNINDNRNTKWTKENRTDIRGILATTNQNKCSQTQLNKCLPRNNNNNLNKNNQTHEQQQVQRSSKNNKNNKLSWTIYFTMTNNRSKKGNQTSRGRIEKRMKLTTKSKMRKQPPQQRIQKNINLSHKYYSVISLGGGGGDNSNNGSSNNNNKCRHKTFLDAQIFSNWGTHRIPAQGDLKNIL